MELIQLNRLHICKQRMFRRVDALTLERDRAVLVTRTEVKREHNGDQGQMTRETVMWAVIGALIIALVYTYYNPKAPEMIQSSPTIGQKQ